MTTDTVKVVFISKHFYPRAGSRIGPQYRWTCGQYRCQYLFTQCCVMDPQRYVLCTKINCSKTLVWVIFQLISLLTFSFYSCQRRCCTNNTPQFSETGMHLLVNFVLMIGLDELIFDRTQTQCCEQVPILMPQSQCYYKGLKSMWSW